MIQINRSSRVSIPVSGSENTPAYKFKSGFITQVIIIFSIKHTVGKGLYRTNAKEIPSKSCSITVDIVKGGTFLWGYACAHSTLKALEKPANMRWRHQPCSSPYP